MNLNFRSIGRYRGDRLLGILYNLVYSFQIEDSRNRFRYFHHHKNCGFPRYRRTERTVELALADFWLDRVKEVWEVGAVTSYYWPGRVTEVVDPADTHRLVSIPKSLFDINFSDRNVLSISTIEHVGESRYGLNENASPVAALIKLIHESNHLLLTFPLGWTQILDGFVLEGIENELCKVRFLVRNPDETWSPARAETAWRPYGGEGVTWANSIAILEKGNIL